MKILYISLLLIAACGNETTVEDGSQTDQKKQGSTNGSSTITVDLSGIWDVYCAEKDPMSWPCAKRCVKFPDRSWCGVYDPYCASEEGRKEDVEFCSWWDINKPNKE